MKSGAAISGAAHAALVAVMILGLPWFSPRERPPIPVTEVSFVSEAEFEQAQAAAQAVRNEEAAPLQPVARPELIVVETEPEPEPVPEAAPQPEPAPTPPDEIATLEPAFNPDAPLSVPSVEMTLPEPAATPPAQLAAVSPPRSRPEASIAPAPPPVPAELPEPPREEAPPEAPEEVSLDAPAEVPPTTLALERSERPIPRRGNMEAQQADAQASTVVERLRQEVSRQQRETAPTPPTAPSTTQATAPTPPGDTRVTETSLPSGPPITNAERDGLRLAVQKCWNLPAGVREASELKVTLAAELNPDGAVISGSIRLIEPDPAPDARFQAAYDAGRRALLRCSPYTDLPREKYARWRNLEVVFNPEGMVSW